ncbi:MAG: dihydroneopterin aldolase [Porphyromonas sp.]|nr:dihydroneopterin aldolase [Porphyromonas sp.]
MKIEETSITLSKMRFYAYHGVLPQEQTVGNQYEMTLTLYFDAGQAMLSDRLTDTINYAEVYGLISKVMAQRGIQLLEKVVGNVLEMLRQHFPQLNGATCQLTKITPPIEGFDGAGVSFSAAASW